MVVNGHPQLKILIVKSGQNGPLVGQNGFIDPGELFPNYKDFTTRVQNHGPGTDARRDIIGIRAKWIIKTCKCINN